MANSTLFSWILGLVCFSKSPQLEAETPAKIYSIVAIRMMMRFIHNANQLFKNIDKKLQGRQQDTFPDKGHVPAFIFFHLLPRLLVSSSRSSRR